MIGTICRSTAAAAAALLLVSCGSAGGSTSSEPLIVGKPVAQVYSALRKVEIAGEGTPSAVDRELNITTVQVDRVADQSITWRASMGEHKAWDLALRLTPSPGGASTLVTVETVQHALPEGEEVPSGFMKPGMVRLRAVNRLTDRLHELDPAFRKREAVSLWSS